MGKGSGNIYAPASAATGCGSRSGRFNAVTLLRWFFALSLVCFHACILTGRPLLFPVGGHAVVSVFFVLSGMLTFEGFMRRPAAAAFYKRRFMRLFPPYAAVILCSAVALSLLSSLTAGEYFSSPVTLRYVVCNLGLLNFVAPSLPGVFSANAVMAVNSSLWTMKVEVAFYAVMPLIAYLCRRFRSLRVIAVIWLLSAVYYLLLTRLSLASGSTHWEVLRRQLPGELMYFAAGMVASLLREQITGSRRRAFVSLALGAAVWALCSRAVYLRIAEPAGVALCLTVVAYSFPPLSALSIRIPNLTYEVFLIHFPVLQSLIALGLFSRLGFAPAFILSLAAILLLSVLLHRFAQLFS